MPYKYKSFCVRFLMANKNRVGTDKAFNLLLNEFLIKSWTITGYPILWSADWRERKDLALAIM